MRLIPFFPDLQQDFPDLDLPDDNSQPGTGSLLSISASAAPEQPNPITDYYSNQNKKRRGQTVEFRLALECMERNIPIARPYLDCEKYDAVVLPHPEPSTGNHSAALRQGASSLAPKTRNKNNRASAPARETQKAKRETALKLEARASKRARPTGAPSELSQEHQELSRMGWPVAVCSQGELRVKVARVQVRSAHTLHHGAFDIPLTSGASGLPYRLGDFEILAAYVAPERAWYLIPAEALVRNQQPCRDGRAARPSRAKRRSLPAGGQRPTANDAMQTSISLYPHKKGSRGRFEKFRERWDLLT